MNIRYYNTLIGKNQEPFLCFLHFFTILPAGIKNYLLSFVLCMNILKASFDIPSERAIDFYIFTDLI